MPDLPTPSFLPGSALVFVANAGAQNPAVIFFVQIALLIFVGRLLGEWLQRVGQPAVLGQLLAGILLGPTVFGAVWPSVQHVIFPPASAARPMLTAVSELGVLMLLLLTGMETDLALVKRVRRTAAIVSAAGIIIPFACGYLLGEMLPASIIPNPERRLLTSLFLATALSISSVKIVAAVLREVDFLRRDLGQVILAAAILDDTIGWTVLAFIGGLAAHGKVMLGPVLISVFGTIAFLLFCFTIGHRWVARIIRWTNDHLVIEMPVISVILILMIALSLVTDFIGVHTVLGAFVAGIMIGQSPILTKHIEEQLRGLIVALFMPVFFGVAGLSIDLKVLADPQLLGLAFILIAIASIGKLGGCYLGGRLARLNHPESLAIGFGMNARGSTEVILATIGLTMGVLNQRLFTIIVLMAVVTTLCMPPLLRWALARVPVRPDEKARLETEEAEQKDLLPKVERILVGLDASDDARMAGRLAGWVVGARRITATVIDAGGSGVKGDPSSAIAQGVAESAAHAVGAIEHSEAEKDEATRNPDDPAPLLVAKTPVRDLISIRSVETPGETSAESAALAILAEAGKGYGLLIVGLDAGSPTGAQSLPPTLGKIIREFPGPIAILLTSGHGISDAPLKKILVPTTGADYSRFGAEVAVAIARGCGAAITALHVSVPSPENEVLRHPKTLLRTGRALLADIVALGERENVRVTSKSTISPAKENIILQQAKRGGHQLIVLGTKTRSGEPLHFGNSVDAIIRNATCPVLIVKS